MNLPVANKYLPGSRPGAAYQRGVGMIEILVATLILSIGLLGIALMQVRALSGNNSTMSRSMAVIASYSILDAMRADRANALAGNYNQTMSGDTCTVSTTTLAQSQLISWCTDMANKLGNVSTTQGIISCGTDGTCTVTVKFDESRVGAAANTGTTASPSMITQVFTKAMI